MLNLLYSQKSNCGLSHKIALKTCAKKGNRIREIHEIQIASFESWQDLLIQKLPSIDQL